MKHQTITKEDKKQQEKNKEQLKEEQKFNYPRSTVEMLEQTLQII